MNENLGKSSTGLQPNVAALLSYVAGLITGIIFFVIEKENKFVRFHAMQSIILFGGLLALQLLLNVVPFFAFMMPLINIVTVVLWVVMMLKAYQGETFKLPVIGDMAEQYSKTN